MSDTAYITRNGDGSLRHRVDEYLTSLEAYSNLQHSRKYGEDPEWVDTLGHPEDIAQAEKILEQSLSHATRLIDTEDLKLALSQGFLSEEQASEFSRTKVQMEFERQTDKSRQSQADTSGHRQ